MSSPIVMEFEVSPFEVRTVVTIDAGKGPTARSGGTSTIRGGGSVTLSGGGSVTIGGR